MTISFLRPVGANADVAELEYIAALHQTCQPDLRSDGSIRAIDIVHFLSSRYGIRVTEDEVRKIVLKGMGGGDDEEECLDLCEVVAILLIPLLIKAASELQYGPSTPKQKGDFDTEWEYGDYLMRREVSDSLRPDSSIIRKVLDMILKDVTGDSTPKRLDKALVRSIFEFYGEMELIDDDAIIEEMVDAASGKANENGLDDDACVLDEDAFARALTSDVLKFDVETETSLTTHYYDVFHTHYSTKGRGAAKAAEGNEAVRLISAKGDVHSYRSTDVESQLSGGNEDEGQREVERIWTFASIDYTAGLYRSKLFVVILWFTAVLTFFSYVYGIKSSFGQINCGESNLSMFGCKVANGIIDWIMIFLKLSILGTAFICLGSMGNDIYSTSKLAILVGMATIVMFTIIPFRYEVTTPFFSTVRAPEYLNRYITSLCGGCLLLALQLFHLVRLSIPKKLLRNKRLARFFTPGLVKYEARIKRAAAFKANRLVRNAIEIHQTHPTSSRGLKQTESSYGCALLSFSKFADRYEATGGLVWVWQRILSGTLFTEEGVWLSSRLLAGNASQVFVCVSTVLGGIGLAVNGRDLFKAMDALDENNFLPEPWMIETAIVVGTVCGFLAAACITLINIPSSVSTILQFRSGIIPSLRSFDFSKYRALDNERPTLIFGTLFWGNFVTALCISLLAGFSVILILWQVTRPTVVNLLAQITGIVSTILIKLIVLFFLRKAFYVGFFRTRPAPANFMGLVLEVWNLGLTAGYILGRTAMLVIATALYIGRVDVPFLAPGAARIGPMNLDAYPTTFRKDLLMHDAHRHPYLERLGFCYMLKLRHGENFAKTSGSCWRLLFVFALLPWIRKHRIESRPHLREDDVDTSNFKFSGQRVLGDPSTRRATTNRSDSGSGDHEEEIATLKEEISSLEKEVQRLQKKLIVASFP